MPLDQQRTETSGPSWSWTSGFFEPGLINYSIVASQKPFDDPHNAEVVEIKLLLLFNDGFGSLRAGVLTLKEYTMTVDLTLSLEPAPQPEGMRLGESSSSEDGRKPDSQDHSANEQVAEDSEGKRSQARQNNQGVFLMYAPFSTPKATHRSFEGLLDFHSETFGEVWDKIDSKPSPRVQALMISSFSTLNKKSQHRSGKRAMYYGLLLRRALIPRSWKIVKRVYRRIGIFSMELDSSQDEIKIDRLGAGNALAS